MCIVTIRHILFYSLTSWCGRPRLRSTPRGCEGHMTAGHMTAGQGRIGRWGCDCWHQVCAPTNRNETRGPAERLLPLQDRQQGVMGNTLWSLAVVSSARVCLIKHTCSKQQKFYECVINTTTRAEAPTEVRRRAWSTECFILKVNRCVGDFLSALSWMQLMWCSDIRLKQKPCVSAAEESGPPEQRQNTAGPVEHHTETRLKRISSAAVADRRRTQHGSGGI